MKKFLLVSLLVFSFATLSAVAHASIRLKFQDARNYCRDLNTRLVTAGEIMADANWNKELGYSCRAATFITVDGSYISVSSKCEITGTGRADNNSQYDVVCK